MPLKTKEDDFIADAVTENPMPGDTEVWEIYNLTGDARPVHVHETPFEVLAGPLSASTGTTSRTSGSRPGRPPASRV